MDAKKREKREEGEEKREQNKPIDHVISIFLHFHETIRRIRGVEHLKGRSNLKDTLICLKASIGSIANSANFDYRVYRKLAMISSRYSDKRNNA